MNSWLEMIRPSIEKTTYGTYEKTINGKINLELVQDFSKENRNIFLYVNNSISCRITIAGKAYVQKN